jgi:hypothetical protein
VLLLEGTLAAAILPVNFVFLQNSREMAGKKFQATLR